ncbi:apolipoprotein N-acyltransferase [Mycobacterium paraseoulense]|uniref:Apolipoprotein N-acyltransferase n=1 Tax=Mycobacterium paraseoulense TaxID=590652 RepID=A0A1X0I9W9_9MYCO|nr:apolipoprotein N-acyltransferase [Mycobacterium paraseoulense]MCV7397544.1 apolipoprotein N-acyltransferase [Mycobacterium paraseoulense]ORB39671.1 apolipoprotein N-acyltransferase [Mycobacterium paraseoulense]BBZ70155.1 apolipoprotein N-acyltransferase [Mycobacterium paraseoulense]
MPRRIPGWLVALAAGALPALAFPAPSWWWLAWFGLVPLLLSVRAAPSGPDAAVRAWLGVTGFVLATQYWLAPFLGPLLAGVAVGLGALWLPWGWLAHRLLSAPAGPGRTVAAVVVLPSAWVAAEAVRSWPPLGGSWASLGASQSAQPVTLASASLGGVWLTSFLVVAANTALIGVVVHREASGRLVALGCAVACAAVGPVWYLSGPSPAVGPTLRVALVQPGDIADSGARQAAGEQLTDSVAGQRPDLVVWGESSVGSDLAAHPDVLARLTDVSRRVGADLLVNVDAPAPGGGIYKSAVLIGERGSLGTYRKSRLVPFGEYVPLRPLFGWITRHSGAAAEDRRRGSGPVVLHAGTLPIGPLVSYEALFSDLARREAQLGAELLVYQSSTSSFQGSWAQPQLAAQPAVRAVEAGRPAVHVGLSGDSSAFDARGHRVAWFPSGFRGAAVVGVPLGSRVTPYQRLGDWVPALAFVVLGFALLRCRRPARSDTLPG